MSAADMNAYEATWQDAQRALDRMAEKTDLTGRDAVLIKIARDVNTQNRELIHNAMDRMKERDRAMESLARIKRRMRA